MSAWLRQHATAFGDACRRARYTAGSFLFNAVVIAAVLALPFAGLTLLDNLVPVTRQLAADPEITVFLAPGAKQAKGQAASAGIRRLALEVDPQAGIEFISREQALTSLKSRTAIGDTIAVLGENPLPDAYVVRLSQSDEGRPAQRAEGLAAALAKLDGVEHVQVDSAWISRLAALVRLLRMALVMAAVALGVVVVAVVFNTVRLQVLTQREEIDICRLFGATDTFVSRPFLYAGALLGLLSGALGLGAIAALLPYLNRNVAELARLYGSEFQLLPLGPAQSAGLLVLCMLLGYVGAGMSVRRHLKQSST
ncbi:ABC transporter permease [Lacisediminimonas sp.]|uniref:cell division protein FtsX n=1 Tax=Lacisediminimonas sp. TaxID=3060582 RepID=UPI00271DCBC7|nr:permease-like cell division protein FtsX [Lacisediminimonas sp.]MDO8298633.1 permease-like cell division protein FtsX [Lacisediminimonas sp.]